MPKIHNIAQNGEGQGLQPLPLNVVCDQKNQTSNLHGSDHNHGGLRDVAIGLRERAKVLRG